MNAPMEDAVEEFVLDYESDDAMCTLDNIEGFVEYLYDHTNFEEEWMEDREGARAKLGQYYDAYVKDEYESDLTPEEMIETVEKMDAAHDAVMDYLEERWDGPQLPFVVDSPRVSGVQILCADMTELALEAQKWVGYDEESGEFEDDEEKEFGWVNARLDDFLQKTVQTAQGYADWITSHPWIVVSWFRIKGDYDANTDRFYFKDDKENPFDFINLPVEYLVEHAENTYDLGWLDDSDTKGGYTVYRVPTRWDVMAVFEKSKFVGSYLDFPYVLKRNWIEKGGAVKIEDVDDLMTYCAYNLLGTTTEALLNENLRVSDPAGYVGNMLAYQLHITKPMMRPYISAGGVASSIWDNVMGKGSKSSGKASSRSHKGGNRGGGDEKFSFWDTVMGR